MTEDIILQNCDIDDYRATKGALEQARALEESPFKVLQSITLTSFVVEIVDGEECPKYTFTATYGVL